MNGHDAYDHLDQFYINGAFVSPHGRSRREIVDPATEEVVAEIAMADETDVERAVQAAKRAFKTFGFSSREQRLDLLQKILDIYNARSEEFAVRMTAEMGTPISFSQQVQTPLAGAHIAENIKALKSFQLEVRRGSTSIVREPIGVCSLITPWNWPMLQVITKVAPAIAAGCTIILKPSEYSPLSALLFAEVMHEAGVPPGVFNLINGDGPVAGTALSVHPDIDMVSFTGSTRAGILVAKNAADTVKRVHQELGGKSANIVLPDVDLERAVYKAVDGCYLNAGQSCSAPTRLLVPSHLRERAGEIAKAAAEAFRPGGTFDPSTTLGPVVNSGQHARVMQKIQAGIDEGATLVTGGTGRPLGMNRGYYVKPTVFANVDPSMIVSREEIFGPVLAIQSYNSVDEAIEIANDTVYGLAAYVQSTDLSTARKVAARLRAGDVYLNYPSGDISAPFGGYKQSGNGREYGEGGIDAFLEVKSIIGCYEATQ